MPPSRLSSLHDNWGWTWSSYFSLALSIVAYHILIMGWALLSIEMLINLEWFQSILTLYIARTDTRHEVKWV